MRISLIDSKSHIFGPRFSWAFSYVPDFPVRTDRRVTKVNGASDRPHRFAAWASKDPQTGNCNVRDPTLRLTMNIKTGCKEQRRRLR
jgi:hypothetical protein